MKINKGIIVLTFDDIIVNNSFSLYTFLVNHFSFYNKYLDLYTLRTEKQIYDRKEKNLIKWLSREKDNIDGVYLYTLMYNLAKGFFDKNDYKQLKLSKIGESVLLNPLFYENSGIKEIYILIKYATKKEKEYKEKFINQINSSTKIKLVSINNKSSYYDEMKKIKNWNLLVTDDIDLVEKLSSGNIDHKEFYMPKYGYNEASIQLKELIKQKSGSLIFYNAI